MHIRLAGPIALLIATSMASAQETSSAQYQTSQGELTVHTSQAIPPDYGPPPSFAQLDTRGAGFITATEANAYPPLANDFIHADGNRDGRISRAEYQRWASHQ